MLFGHKTLAVDRLDGEALTWDTGQSTLSDTRRLVPGARLLSYARNRTLDTRHGRWLQEDPNAAGTTTLASVMYHGRGPNAFEVTISVQQRCGDGLSLYGYLSSNPIMLSDPTGLDVFDMVDEYLAVSAGSTAAFLDRIGTGLSTTAYIAGQVAQLYPPIGMGVAAYQLATGNVTVLNVMAVIPGSAYAKLISKAAGTLVSARAAYQAGSILNRAAQGARVIPKELKAGQAIYSVYVGFKNGKAAYVGLTKNFVQRKSQWEGIYEIEQMFTGLTRNQARAIETRYMITQGAKTVDNEILSIAQHREWFEEAMEWAAQYVP